MFDADELVASAQSRTGLADFGDERFLVGLHQFVDGLNATDNIIPGREGELRKLLLRLLCNLLWRQADFAQHPEILEERLLPPVCILSLPRVGTTKLQRQLGVTGAFQNPLYWHLHMPSRVPGLPEGGRQKRIEITEEFCQWREAVSPTINVTHRSFTHEPDEDAFLQQLCFCEDFSKLYNRLPMPLEAFGHMVVDLLHNGMERHMAWREANPQVEVLDLSFREICDDSLGTAEKIHDFLELPLNGDARRRIESWDQENPRHKHGKLELTLEMYGLDERVINAKFGPYREAFGQFL